MGWYLGHFPGAKRVRNDLVRINSLADVERIIQHALDHPEETGDMTQHTPEVIEELRDPELDMSCAI